MLFRSRSSGTLDVLSKVFIPITNLLKFPSELVPLVSVKMFSSSAATGLLLDIYKEFGADSFVGYLASVLMSCSETIFYTLSVYFAATAVSGQKVITKSRWTLPGALLATLAGIIASTILVRGIF